jgi:hypothetical protein
MKTPLWEHGVGVAAEHEAFLLQLLAEALKAGEIG